MKKCYVFVEVPLRRKLSPQSEVSTLVIQPHFFLTWEEALFEGQHSFHLRWHRCPQ